MPQAAPGSANNSPTTLVGTAVATASALLVLGAVTLTAPFLIVPWLPRKVFGALPWLATGPVRCAAMLDAIPSAVRGARFIDLGSGDGEAVLAAARRGMLAHGVELNPVLVALSRWRAAREGLSCTFRSGNLFDEDVRNADVVFVFGVPPLMARIGDKLAAELPERAWVLTHKFPLQGAWEAAHVQVVRDVHIYSAQRRRVVVGALS